MAEDRAEWEGKVYRSGPDSSLPPLATTRCNIEDGGRDTQIDADRVLGSLNIPLFFDAVLHFYLLSYALFVLL